MSGIATAIVGGAVIGGIATSSAADSAADAQTQAANQANATQRYMYDVTRKDSEPYRNNGYAANNVLAAYLGLNQPQSYSADQIRQMAINEGYGGGQKPGSDEVWDVGLLNDEVNRRLAQQQSTLDAYSSAKQNGTFGSLLKPFSQADLEADPIYKNTLQFALDQGTQGINRQAAASGGLLSGNTLKALTRFGANTAATYGNDAYNRYNTTQQNQFNRLAGITGAGQSATNQVSAAGQNTANQIGNNLTGLGNARGASAIAQGNSISNGISQAYNGYQQNRLMNGLLGSGYQPNANGIGSNPYSGYDAASNGGWGIE